LRITFDETTIRCIVLCVIVGFVNGDGRMQQRVFKVALYKESPEEKLTNQMSDHIITAIEECLQTPKAFIKVFGRDGVILNELTITKLIGGEVIDPNTNKKIMMPGIYSKAINIKCMSHTMDNTGVDYRIKGVKFNRIEGPNARILFNQINGLFCGPGTAMKTLWAKSSGSTFPSYAETRWWSREEVWEYFINFCKFDEGDNSLWFDEWINERVQKFKEEKKEIGAYLARLYKILVPGAVGHDPSFLVTAFVEMAIVVDVTKKMREATYLVEGDGPISVIILEILNSLKRYYDTTHQELEYPNVKKYIALAVSKKIFPPGFVNLVVVPPVVLVPPLYPGDDIVPPVVLVPPLYPGDDIVPRPIDLPAVDPMTIVIDPPVVVPLAIVVQPPIISDEDLENAWNAYCLKISAPFMAYFEEKVMGHNCIHLWDAASMADPLNMKRKKITPNEIRTKVKPLIGNLLTKTLVDNMVGELSEYDKACDTLDWSNDTYQLRLVNVETFWASHKLLPAWTEFAHLVFLMQPSSACVERSFSMLKYIMTSQQANSLNDKIEASLMLRYNRGKKSLSKDELELRRIDFL
jgi:hypothetical protein